MDWDDAYANTPHIPGASALPGIWADDARRYRAACAHLDQDIPYGSGPRALIDLVWPDVPPVGLCIFVHGGYWLASDKSDWTHFAEGARANGWAFALLGYQLAPHARITDITGQIGAAIAMVAGRVAGPITLVGHSAGGHLIARMLCSDSPLSAGLLARITRGVAISGLFDLRPLLHTKMNAILALDDTEAAQQSPALLSPIAGIILTAWVGGGERPEFLRQSRLITQNWHDAGVRLVIDGDHNHFSILDGLKDPHSALCKTILG